MFQRLKRGGWPYPQPPNVPFDPNWDSEQAEGLVMWMPWGGGTPGAYRHVDRVGGLVFTEGGTPVWVNDGQRGWSMLFDDGNNESLSVATGIVTAPPFTLACWAMSDDAAQGSQTAIGLWGGGFDYFNLYMHGWGGANQVSMRSRGDAIGTAEVATAWAAGTWHHICGVVAATNSRTVYQDGPANQDSDATAVTVDPVPSQIFISSRSGAEYFSGRIMDARIYNVAKTDAQVQQMYANPWELYRPRVRRLWAMAPAAPAVGQPMMLRGTTVPGLRQWHPRV